LKQKKTKKTKKTKEKGSVPILKKKEVLKKKRDCVFNL